MQKVLILSPDLSVKGGVSSVVRSFMTELEKRDICVKQYNTYIDKIHPVLRVVYSLFRICYFFIALYPFRYNVFYLHVCAFGSFYRKAFYVLLLNLLRKKVVLHQHAADLEIFLNKNKFNKWLGKRVFTSSTRIFVLSQNMYEITKAATTNEHIHVVENPIELPEFVKNQDDEAKGKVKLVFLGEIGKRKGVYDLIQAIAELSDEQKGNICVDIGGNNELDKLTSMIQEYGLENTCIVHGWVDREGKAKLLKEASVFILPSYFEGVPISILEAMSYELPVISTNVAGIPEIVLHQYNGLIIEPGDIAGLKRSILYLVENAELIHQYGKNSRILVEKHDVPIVVDKILSLFENEIRNSKLEKNLV